MIGQGNNMNCEFGSSSHMPQYLMEDNSFIIPCNGWTLEHYIHRHCQLTKKDLKELTNRNNISESPHRMHDDCLLCDEDMETEMDQYRYWNP
jgi:hypothetical protein